MYDMIDLGAEASQKKFLGTEFLLWLWYRIEKEDNYFTVNENSFEVSFDDQLMLEVQLAEAEQTRLKGGAPAHAPEAYKAIQYGKRIAKARMRIAHAEREWKFMIDAETFAMSGIKIPAVLKDAEDDKIDERLYLIQELDDVWSGIYHQFLRIRLAPEWTKETQEITDYIHSLRDGA